MVTTTKNINNIPQGEAVEGAGKDDRETSASGTVQDKNGKKKKKHKHKPLDLEEFDDASKFINENTRNIKLQINPSMLPLLAPTTMSTIEKGEVQYNLPDCNHNTPNRAKVCKIINNMINNPMGVKNQHDRSLGADGELLAIKWNKVSYFKPWKYY